MSVFDVDISLSPEELGMIGRECLALQTAESLALREQSIAFAAPHLR